MSTAFVPLNIEDLEKYAGKNLNKLAFDYYSSGSDDQVTLGWNEEDYTKIKLLPRLRPDPKTVSMREQKRQQKGVEGTGSEVLHQLVNMEAEWSAGSLRSFVFHGSKRIWAANAPFGIAPTAMQAMAHSDGELASVRAAVKAGIPFILSSWSTYSIEDVAKVAFDKYRQLTQSNSTDLTPPRRPILWFQLYVYTDRTITFDLIERAHKAGFTALVITTDTPRLGRRVADIRNEFSLPSHLQLANFESCAHMASPSQNRPSFPYSWERHSSEEAPGKVMRSGSGLSAYVSTHIDPTLSWEDLKEIKLKSPMPVFVKGVLSPVDAAMAVSSNLDGIIVSNHGGRQLDTVPSTIECLPAIIDTVKGKIPVYLDGGIRKGTDILKALAIGASGVFIGRPILWGLSYKGEEGVDWVIQHLKDQLALALLLSGCTSLRDISPSLIFKPHSKL